ncbi:MAG: phosphatidylserine decarboxylase [Hyphomicrobiales bacterium]|nr:phosphatidylserine decarboxylase [Hyphomicrobiales bacterium]
MKSVFVPINSAGWPFIAVFAICSAILASLSQPMGWLGALVTAWSIYFFRDPPRVTPTRDDLVISPADGVVQLIDTAPPPPELEMGDEPRPRICVFMNVFDVHVNRNPCDGTIAKLAYRPGKFLNASLDKASEFNERQSVRLTLRDGRDMAYVQIAGLVARRILCWARVGDQVRAGERFGMIRFGSRVDVYLPTGVEPLVAVGQRAVAGETVIADMRGQEPAREGEVR